MIRSAIRDALRGAIRRAITSPGVGGGPSLPVNTFAPAITGQPYIGETLTATPGTWMGADSVSGQWYVDGAATGDTDTGYTILLADAGKNVEYRETTTNTAGSVTQASNSIAIVDWSDIVLPSALGSGVSFTRSTTGTYIGADGLMHVAAINGPRYAYDAAGNYLGLLVEEQRTNLVANSSSGYSPQRGSISNNVATAPDGTNTADKFVENTATGDHYITVFTTPQPAGTYTCSIHIKADERKTARVHNLASGAAASNCVVNLSTGAVVSGTATVVDIGDGWWRIILPPITSTGTGGVGIYAYTQPPSNIGDGSSGFNVWGAQIEPGAFATSYIPTAGAAVTRGADVVSIANLADIGFDSSQGMMLFDGYAAPGTGASNTSILSFNDGTANERIEIRRVASSTTVDAVVTDNGADQFDSAGVGVADNAAFKTSLAWALNDFAFCVNAGTMQVDNSGTLPTPSRFAIGAFNGNAKNVRYYPHRLSNAIMQAATA